MRYNKTLLLATLSGIIVGGAGVLLIANDNSTNMPNTSGLMGGGAMDYSNRGLTQFPKEILSSNNATSLNLSGNSLGGSLPAEIKNLTRLQELNVSNNRMTGIPAEIGQMNSLRILNYANNQITGLPNELGNLTQLQTFDLRGNPNVSQQDLGQIRSKLPNTQIKF